MQVYIDGAAGATGLAIEERLAGLADITIIAPPPALRKDTDTRRDFLNRADVAFLCLPDVAAREAVSLVDNQSTVIIDASTAHRTAEGWAYGFPELSASHLEALLTANRIAVPGCHASGFCALVYPLKTRGFIDPAQPLYCHSLTGYSGGGKALISEYEPDAPSAARLYALGLQHKHLPEMRHVCGLELPPIFVPALVPVRQGMLVNVPLAADAAAVHAILAAHYQDTENIKVMPLNATEAITIEDLNGTDRMEIFVSGHSTQTVLTARFDNLGKGSAGAALQCLKVRMKL